MKTSAILRRAAEGVSDASSIQRYAMGGCYAIRLAVIDSRRMAYGKKHNKAIRYFNMVRPYDQSFGYWWTLENSKYASQARVIGLLLAAAIAESEGD